MSNDPKDLTTKIYAQWQEWDARMTAKGIPHKITRVACRIDEQMALYVKGRLPLKDVNRFMVAAGLPVIGQADDNVVTWTLASKHIINPPLIICSFAFDFAILKNGTPTWDIKVDVNQNDIPDYQEAGQIGKDCGLTWGGDFPTPDYCHLQGT